MVLLIRYEVAMKNTAPSDTTLLPMTFVAL
jgi:hypothetical protein